MRASGGLRESGESDARARLEGSCANVHTLRAGRFARAPGAQGAGDLSPAVLLPQNQLHRGPITDVCRYAAGLPVLRFIGVNKS